MSAHKNIEADAEQYLWFAHVATLSSRTEQQEAEYDALIEQDPWQLYRKYLVSSDADNMLEFVTYVIAHAKSKEVLEYVLSGASCEAIEKFPELEAKIAKAMQTRIETL